jgi:hypothetical protein
MVNSEFNTLLKNPKELKDQQIPDLKLVVEQFPYLQSARTLYLKGLKNLDSFKYNNELKTTAAYTADRTVLFHFISALVFNDKTTNKSVKTINETSENLASLSLGKPLPFSLNEKHSFNEWLQLTPKKPIVRTFEKKENKDPKKTSIINRFIERNPKIIPLEKSKVVSIAVSEKTSETFLMTETLAKVYLEQKKYKSALQAYKILSLKYPEKSSFFATQINSIRILEKTKL